MPEETKSRSDKLLLVGACVLGCLVLLMLAGTGVWLVRSRGFVRPSVTSTQTNDHAKSPVESPSDREKDISFLKIFQNLDFTGPLEQETFGNRFSDFRSQKITAKKYGTYLSQDETFWEEYVTRLSTSDPKNPFLLEEKTQILPFFQSLAHNSQAMNNAVSFEDKKSLQSIYGAHLGIFRMMTVQYDLIVSQMPKYSVPLDHGDSALFQKNPVLGGE